MNYAKHISLIAILLLLVTSSFYGKKLYEGDEYLAFAEEMPQPVGGLPAIYKLIKYPQLAKDAGLQGKVYVLAYIDTDGSVEDVKVIKGIGGGCDEATINAIKQCKFTPGKSKGQNVKVKMSLQIQFKLK
jgi:protein TonB